APLLVASVERGGSDVQFDEDLTGDCSEALAQVEVELQAAHVHADCLRLRSTSAARALHELAEEEDAGLLVVGSSRKSAVGRVLAGWTGTRLLHGAPCPVAVVPIDWSGEKPPATIGVAYTDSPTGRDALRGGFALAHRIGALLRVVTAVPHTEGMHLETDPPIAPVVDRRDVVDVEGEHRLEAEAHLRAVVAELEGDVPVEAEALVGDPAKVLVDFSKGVDLLVVGSRGYGPARAVLLGSVSRRVMGEAYCPVLVLPRGVEAALEALLGSARGESAPA
ncbi:MAG TPA: universal stress protein, partial [Thermoleophilaceae bacterium]|nr:universal stress protein [Thermoleophilaceae bacterium]